MPLADTNSIKKGNRITQQRKGFYTNKQLKFHKKSRSNFLAQQNRFLSSP